MIVFLTSEDYSNLLQNSEEFIHKYVKWRYDLNFFLKEEYANLMAMDPEWIIIEEKAIDDPSKMDGVIQCFPRAKFVYITSQKEEKRITGKCKTIYTDGFLKERLESMIFGKKVNLQQEQKKIGVITDQDPELAKRFTLNLLYCIKREERLLVYTEVGQESGLEEAALKYGLLKTEKGYEYDGIPILHNLVIGQALINLFDFGVTEEKKEKMFEKCDYRFRINLEGKKIRVDFQEQTYTIAAFHNPFQPGQERFYADLLPELHLQVPDAKMKRVRLLQKKERSQKVKKSKPTKKPRVKMQIPKPSLPKPNLSKWKERYLTKRRLMIFVGILAMISIVAAGLRTYSASQKKEQIKEAVKEQQSTVVPSTAEKTSEKVPTEKKKNKKLKPTTEDIQKTTSSQSTTEAAVSNTAATRRLNQGSRTTTTQRPKPTTTRKKRVTTTIKKKTTTTQRPKPTTTTERFEIEHGPE